MGKILSICGSHEEEYLRRVEVSIDEARVIEDHYLPKDTTLFNESQHKRIMKLSPILLPEVEIPKLYSPTRHLVIDANHPDVNYQETLLRYMTSAKHNIHFIKGELKSDLSVIEKVQKSFIENILYEKYQTHTRLPSDYKYFGTDNSKINLEQLLRSNPIFASALVYDDEAKRFILPPISQKNTFYTRIFNLVNQLYPRIHASFNATMQLVTINGEEIFDIEVIQRMCSQLLFQLFVYAECVHAVIHMFQYLLMLGIVDSTRHDIKLRAWAYSYTHNIEAAHREMNHAFLNEDGMLSENDVIEDHMELILILREMLCLWGGYSGSEEFIKKFIFSGLQSSEAQLACKQIGLLSQFNDQAALIKPYASELHEIFRKDDFRSLFVFNNNIKAFFSTIGDEKEKMYDVTKISNIKTWTELMSVTGLLHSATYSFTRLIMTEPILSRISPKSDMYVDIHLNYIVSASSTLIGISKGHYFMNSNYGGLRLTIPEVRNLMQEYDKKSTKLKEDFELILRSEEKFFKGYGWIYTEYCSDLLDGKQLSMTANA